MYSTGFQCPATGQYVRARYAFGKVTISAALMDDESLHPDTEAWIKKHTNHRAHSFIEADEYVMKVSEGQTFGLERD
jgi:hypothetical protein